MKPESLQLRPIRLICGSTGDAVVAVPPPASIDMSSAAASAAPEDFPAGLRVLVVDDDVTCLRLLEQMLQRCRYRVTVCCQATLALSLLRERKDCYDVVISDVHMPDMDGYKLLELVGLEMDLPVIMMSADGRTSAVLRGINHGACDYLIKPVRIEELKNIWQHVARKKWHNKEADHLGNLEDSDRQRRLNDRVDGTIKSQKKKRDVKENEDDSELDIEDPSTSKKPRVVWSVELHQQFISAVGKLGIEKAVPKRILELMNVPWLTRENVASHLQKFRQYLKRVAQHPGGVPNFFNDPIESNAAAGSVSRLNFQGLVASGQIPAQTLAALHEELLGQPSGGLLLPTLDKHHLFQTSFQGSKCHPMESDISFGLPLLKGGTEKLNHLPQASIAVENMSSGFSDTRGGINSTQNGSLLKMAVQQQQQSDAISAESCHAFNMRPSVVLPPRPDSFQINNMPVLLNQNTFVSKSIFTPTGISPGVGERILLSQYNNMPMSVAGLSDGVLKNVGMLDGSSTPGQLSSPSVSSSGSSRSVFTDINTGSEVLNSNVNFGSASRLTHQPNFCVLGSEAKTGTLPPRGHGRYLGFVGKKTCISSRFAVDDLDASTCNMDDRSASIGDDGDRLKQGHYATTFFCK